MLYHSNMLNDWAVQKLTDCYNIDMVIESKNVLYLLLSEINGKIINFFNTEISFSSFHWKNLKKSLIDDAVVTCLIICD